MTENLDGERRRLLRKAFKMPGAQTISARTSSITNAFVHSVLPRHRPTDEEIEEALRILRMEPNDVRCAYCGDKSSEWDHLRPIVEKVRPTGFISEIANLVPACRSCNQSKRNANWREWMLSGVDGSPSARGIADVAERIVLLERYEEWKAPIRIDFSAILGPEDWDAYWIHYTQAKAELKKCDDLARTLKVRIDASLGR